MIAICLLTALALLSVMVPRALSANRDLKRYVDQAMRQYPIYQYVHVYQGALLGWCGGYVRPLITGDVFAGIAYEESDNTSGASGALRVRVWTQGDIDHYLSGAAVANNGRCVYASDDETITLSGDANSLVGTQCGYVDSTHIVLRSEALGDKLPALPHVGTETYPFTRTSATKFGQVYVRSNAASGTARGFYIRHHFAGGCGGEALRAYGTVEAAAPVDTCNGAHISLDFGLTAGTGNCTGQADAGRFTLHLPTGRTIGGTIGGVRSELWADGAAPNVSNCAFFTAHSGGDVTGAAVIDTKAHLFRINSPPVNGSMIEAGTGMGTVEGTIRILLNGAAKYVPYYAAPG